MQELLHIKDILVQVGWSTAVIVIGLILLKIVSRRRLSRFRLILDARFKEREDA